MLKINKKNIAGFIILLLLCSSIIFFDNILWGIQYLKFKIDLGNAGFSKSESAFPLLYYEKISEDDIVKYLNQSNDAVVLIKVITTPNNGRAKILSEVNDFRDNVFRECHIAGLKWIQMPIPREKNTMEDFIKYYKSREWIE